MKLPAFLKDIISKGKSRIDGILKSEGVRKTIDAVKRVLPKGFPLRKAFVAGMGLLLVIGAGITVKKVFFDKKDKPKDAGAPQVKVRRAKREKLSETYSVMGTIRGSVENELRFEIEGTLYRYNFPEGATVKKGDIICSIDPKDSMSKAAYARSKYNSEKAVYFSAAQRLKVYRELLSMKAISETKYQEALYETDAAREKMEAALSELRLAQSSLDKTNLTAPSGGIFAEKLIDAGEFITPSDVVARFVSGGEVHFEVDIPEKDVQKLRPDMKAKINCDAYPDVEFMGTVKEIAQIVKERTRTAQVKIALPNDQGKLRSGMFARGEIYIVELEDAITVPEDSVISLGMETKLVPLVKPDHAVPDSGMVELRQVITGQTIKKSVVIEDGLFPDELIIIETQTQLSDGLVVKYQEEESTDAELPKKHGFN